MIVETAIVCATVVVVASLRTAAKFAPPKPRLTKEAIEEKRRVLERTRNEKFVPQKNGTNVAPAAAIDEIDKQLLALADEEREP